MPHGKDFKVDIHKKCDFQNVHKWNRFYAVIPRTPSQPSAIGYTSFIPAPLTKTPVVHTLLVNTATMLYRIGKKNPEVEIKGRGK